MEKTSLEAPSTKTMANFLKKLGNERRTTFIGTSAQIVDVEDLEKLFQSDLLALSVANLPKIEYRSISNINGYDLIKTHNLVIEESALDSFKALMPEGSKVVKELVNE